MARKKDLKRKYVNPKKEEDNKEKSEESRVEHDIEVLAYCCFCICVLLPYYYSLNKHYYYYASNNITRHILIYCFNIVGL